MLFSSTMMLNFKQASLFILVVLLGGSNGAELNLNFQQNDYRFKFERVELVSFNKNLVRDVSVATFKYNRTTALINMTYTFMADYGYDLTVVIQGYKFMSNEYRYFPIRFAANACKALASNVGGVKAFTKCGNFTGCPFRKGKYHICNWQPDPAKHPPFIPNGQYKLEIQLLHYSKEIGVINEYVIIDRPIV